MRQTLDLCSPATRESGSGRPATERADQLAVSNEAVSRAYAVAYRMTGSASVAEAATTEALLRAGRPFDPARVYQLAVRAVLDLRRTRPTDRDEPAVAEAPAGDRSSRLEAAIAALPPPYRDPFVLADVERLPVPVVGELLGMTVPAVKSRLHRARMLLCAALRDVA
jgi:RNA polymerase sigma-70 factor (ECF subfamily)